MEPGNEGNTGVPAGSDRAALRHLAIIMDGNRRWAELRGLPADRGWEEGEQRLYELTKWVGHKGVSVLSVFAFSSENWRREQSQIEKLLRQLRRAIDSRRRELVDEKIQVRFVGSRDRLDAADCRAMADLERETANPAPRLNLVVSFDYGGQWDLLMATRRIAEEVQSGELSLEAVDAQALEKRTAMGDYPPVDLLIRTGGEQRISNFMLWQLAYAEFYFTGCLWPDFGRNEMEWALAAYSRRERRFGGEG